MAETSTEQVLVLPLWLIYLCRWFWAKKGRVWGLIGSKAAALLIWLCGVALVTAAPNWQVLPLRRSIDVLARNAVLFSALILFLFFFLLAFTFISYIISHIPEASLPEAWQAEKRKREQTKAESDSKQTYLRALSEQVRLLPRLGLGVDVTAPPSVELADVFIPLELRASPRPLKLLPLSPDELENVAGLDRQQADYLLLDPKGEWERTLLKSDRLDIATLWEQLSQTQPVAVIQGSPGMGKSTLLARIALSLALQGQNKIDTQLPLKPSLMPILLSIKEYADYLQQPGLGWDRSLMTFLIQNVEQKLNSQGVSAAQAIAEQVKVWLIDRQCLVMFDGLDEVSDKTLQQEIQKEIHNFIEQQRHPDTRSLSWNRFLITSRIAEYDAPDLENYRYFLVAELSRGQISAFLPHWYQTSGASMRIEELIKELLAAYDSNEAVQKLAGNPLLLTLMAILLHNGTHLPERRVELYQAVVKTLLESRNEIKGLPKMYEDEAIQRLGKLAFTMQGVGNNLAHRTEVEAAIQATLVPPSGSLGIQNVGEYLELISKRGGLFIERTAKYYGFIHRSFQEYFAARHMLREIEDDRDQKIKEYIQLLHDNPNAWREPFILAVAFKSDRDGGPVATSMLRPLLNSRGKNTLHDVLLTAICIAEAKYINIDGRLQRETVERLLFQYALAQRERRFDDCISIERVVLDWLLVLREGETYLELPRKLQDAIVDGKQPEHQRTVLTLLCAIITHLRSMRYDLFALLIPPLLALTGLDDVPPYAPAGDVSIASELDVADLAITLLFLMESRSPGKLLLQRVQNYFNEHPEYLRELARYSLISGTLITPVLMPKLQEPLILKNAIDLWIKLSNRSQPQNITKRDIEECLSVQQIILNNADILRYPFILYIKSMLQKSIGDLVRWKDTWQSYLLEQLDITSYIHYQQIVLLWVLLFPKKQDLEILAERILLHFNSSSSSQKRYSYRFLLTLIDDLRECRYLKFPRDLGLGYPKISHRRSVYGEERDVRDIKNIRHIRYIRDLLNLAPLYDGASDEIHRYLAFFTFGNIFRDNFTHIAYMDVRQKGAYMIPIKNIDPINKSIKILRDLLLNPNIAEKVRTDLLSQSDSAFITDQLTILMGRVLQVQETGEAGQQTDEEVQRFAAVALNYLVRKDVNAGAHEVALDILRSLPACTAHDIRSLWQIIQGTTETRIITACLQALSSDIPKEDNAWMEIEQGKISPVEQVREVVKAILASRK